MTFALWVDLVCVTGCLVAIVVFGIRKPKSEFARLAKKIGLPESHGLARAMGVEERRQSRGGIVGLAVGLVVAGVCLFWFGEPRGEIDQLVLLTCAFAFANAGSTAASLARETRRHKRQVQVARTRALVLGDYLSPLAQWTPRVTVLVAVAVGVLAIWGTPHAGIAVILVCSYLLLTVGTLLVYEIGARIVVRGSQPAGSELELAWDDSLRVQALLGMSVAPTYLGAYIGIALSTIWYSLDIHPDPYGLTGLSYPLALIAPLAIAARAAQKPPWFVRRLWPELAATALSTDDYWAQVAEHEALNNRRRLRKESGLS